MSKKFFYAILIVVLTGIATSNVKADEVVVIPSHGTPAYIYGGYSYIPLKSATDFLGAALLWDSMKRRASITYGGHQLALVIGSTTAYYHGRPVALPVAPVLVGDQILAPAFIFDHYLEVPVRWDEDDDRSNDLASCFPDCSSFAFAAFTTPSA